MEKGLNMPTLCVNKALQPSCEKADAQNITELLSDSKLDFRKSCPPIFSCSHAVTRARKSSLQR